MVHKLLEKDAWRTKISPASSMIPATPLEADAHMDPIPIGFCQHGTFNLSMDRYYYNKLSTSSLANVDNFCYTIMAIMRSLSAGADLAPPITDRLQKKRE